MSQLDRDFARAEREYLDEPPDREHPSDREEREFQARRDDWTEQDYANAAEYERRREAGEFNRRTT